MTTRLSKPVRRLVDVRGVDYVVELSAAGVAFRRKGRRFTVVAPIALVLALAERASGETAWANRQLAAAARKRGRR